MACSLRGKSSSFIMVVINQTRTTLQTKITIIRVLEDVLAVTKDKETQKFINGKLRSHRRNAMWLRNQIDRDKAHLVRALQADIIEPCA